MSDITQVTDDWQLIVVRRSASFVRRLDGDEQQALRELLGKFAMLNQGQSDAADVADGMSSVLVARGTGSGRGTAAHAEQLFTLLLKAAAKKTSD